jgi:hypothetical protein
MEGAKAGIMSNASGRAYRFLVVIGLYLFAAGVLYCQDRVEASRGTVNIALEDANGIVLLTDSAESRHVANGWSHSWPAQKLFRLDDKTVCSIAGFGSEKGWLEPKMDTYVAGIIADIRDQLAQKPVAELDAKISAVAFLVGHYIDVLANRQEVISNPNVHFDPNSYKFEVIAAGYDKDGTPKVRKLILTLTAVRTADGKRVWTHTTLPEKATVEKGLTHLLGGMPTVSQKILDSPDEFPASVAIKRYARFKATNNGKPLSLRELAALAREMAAKTSQDQRFAGFVGGPVQIAILADGKVQKFEQPTFPEPPRPLKFSLMVDLEITGSLRFVAMGSYLLWIRSNFIGIRDLGFRLDDQFFYGCEIRDSIVKYGGGLTDFGATNKVIDSMLLPSGGGPGSSIESFQRVANAFDWRVTPPDAPPLPPAIGPRQPH